MKTQGRDDQRCFSPSTSSSTPVIAVAKSPNRPIEKLIASRGDRVSAQIGSPAAKAPTTDPVAYRVRVYSTHFGVHRLANRCTGPPRSSGMARHLRFGV